MSHELISPTNQSIHVIDGVTVISLLLATNTKQVRPHFVYAKSP